MIVAVTGSTGHLGANLVRALLASGRKVRALTHGCAAGLEGLEVERMPIDVTDLASVRRGLEGAEVVYHLASMISITGSHGGLVERINVDGTRHVATAALEQGVRRMVHFSSVHAFDLRDRSRVVDETNPRAGREHPTYDQSKAAGERELRRVIERGLDAVVVHPGGCIGPYDFRMSRMGRMFMLLYQRRMPALTGGGFHWVDTRDVAAGAMAAETRGRTGESYILSNRFASIRELADMAQSVTGVVAPRAVVPISVARLGAPVVSLANRLMRNEPLYTSEGLHALRTSERLSTKKARHELGFVTRPLPDTVADIYDWFKQSGRLLNTR